MFIRAYVGSQGKGSYKHEALISSGFYLLNDEKGIQEKAPISCCVFVSGDGGRAHNKRCQKTTTKKTHFLALKPTLSIRWFLIAHIPGLTVGKLPFALGLTGGLRSVIKSPCCLRTYMWSLPVSLRLTCTSWT